ncbi:MAG: sulfatase-like hydrolase/transferase [Hyphomicrobiaceae bacterium]|nr:sulfatase-like hydrolase/transferase [Hyphomicrobiaceae bacterium]
MRDQTLLFTQPVASRQHLALAAQMLITAVWGTAFFVFSSEESAIAKISPSTVARHCAAITALLMVLGTIAFLISRRLSYPRQFTLVALCGSAYLVVAGLLLPLPNQFDMNVSGTGGVVLANWLASVAIATGIGMLLHTRFSRLAVWGIVAFCLSTLAQSVVTFANWREPNSSILRLSTERNIIVVSFDGIQGDIFRDALKKNSDALDLLKGFTVFQNVIASSPATVASLAAETIGNQNFKATAKTTRQLIDFARQQGLFQKLNDSGFRVGTYGDYALLFSQSANLGRHLNSHSNLPDLESLSQVAAARVLGPAASSRLVRRMISLLAALSANPASPLANEVSNHPGPYWDRSSILTIEDFNDYTETLDVGSGAPVAHFLHFTFTHFPVDFDADCSFSSNKLNWYLKHQNREGQSLEAVCSIKLLERFLSRLKTLGVLDKSLVILKSDHGAPVAWNQGGGIASLSIRNSELWGLGRYLPVLLMRSPDSTEASALKYDDRPVILDDLALTECLWAKLSGCSVYNGANLLDPTDRGSSTYWINIVNDAQSSFRYDDHEAVELNRSSSPLDELRRKLNLEKAGDINSPHRRGAN